MKFLGIDYGLSKIGLAMGDSSINIATPLEVVINHEEILEYLAHLIKEEGVEEVVIGLPEERQGEITAEFIKQLKGVVSIPIHTIDESFTTVESQRMQKEDKSKVEEDALAAMIILQSYFDKR